MPPASLSFTSINGTSAWLTWQPPSIESNCSFTYAISISNGSVVIYRTSETTSLVVHLSVGKEYSFAVAVEDGNYNKGPWSETTGILWQGIVKKK